MSVDLYNKIDIRKISVKKKIACYGNSYRHFIKYNKEYPLLIQTPTLTLTFGITQFGINKYIDTSIFNHDSDIIDFKTKIENINRSILRRINNECKNKTYVDNLKKSEKYGDKLRFFLSDNIIYFDENKKKIKCDLIKGKNHIKLIICPIYVWYTLNTYGIRWEVIQLKLYGASPILSKYSFSDVSEPPPPPPPPPLPSRQPPSEYIPYFDLVKRGVPKQAVKNKLLALNMDPSILELSYTAPLIKKTNTQLMEQIRCGNFKLNKIKCSNNSKKSIYEAPTLDEIRLKLNNLRKI